MTTYYGLTPVLDPDNIKITQSDLAAYKRDRRIWFLKTFLGIRSKTIDSIGPLTAGTMAHAALEAKYKYGEDMLPWYRDYARREFEVHRKADPYLQRAAWDAQAELIRVVLEGYEEWIDADNLDAPWETVDVERLLEVRATVNGYPVLLTGKVDLIMRNRFTGAQRIFDWKTTNNIERTLMQAHSTEQLPFYMTLLMALEPHTRVDGAAFNVLLKSKRTARAKPPFYKRETVGYDTRALTARQASIDGTISDYVTTVTRLHEGVAEPLRVCYANPGVLNFDRGLNPLIDIMDNGGNVAGIIRSQYQQVNPYARYNQPESALLSED